jgi:lipid A 3-O-deacylase
MRIVALLLLLMAARPAAAVDNGLHKNIANIGSVLAYTVAAVLGDRPLDTALRPEIERRGLGLQPGTEHGRSDKLDLYQVTYNWYWRAPLIERQSWRMKGAWQVNASVWRADETHANDTIYNVGITPFLRFEPTSRIEGVIPYVEFGLGPQLISQTRIANRQKSTRLQLGGNYGVGIVFGSRDEFRIGYRFVHVSNADIRKPNAAVDFYGAFFEYRY